MSSPDTALGTGEKRKLTLLAADLADWYRQGGGRSFPWREPGTPLYQLVCVEVLLQRTRAETVASFYHRFFTRFPGWHELADAPAEELEEFLKPLGLWKRRTASLRALAAYAAEHDGMFPNRYEELLQVPAVGQYVAHAILMFQHGKCFPLIDVNMARVVERFVRPRKLADIRYDPWLQQACKWLMRRGDPKMVNWSVLDHAALTCRARNPDCQSCLVSSRCAFKAAD
ncbi:MAG: hypothetical protein V2I43_18840 [Parvularcula sp.]|jgi:A/G-specific adenine glycosylase|nr:hypothetical protein [Parvularcula sp.]